MASYTYIQNNFYGGSNTRNNMWSRYPRPYCYGGGLYQPFMPSYATKAIGRYMAFSMLQYMLNPGLYQQPQLNSNNNGVTSNELNEVNQLYLA